MISAPIGLIVFSLAHGTLSWSETQHLANAGLDEWIQHLTNIQGRWLAAHIGGVALFPLLGATIWWMLPPRGIVSGVSKVALTVYAPLYIAVDSVLGIGSSILIHYREGLAASDRAGVDGAFEALFFAPSAIDWLDQGASIAWEIGAVAAALALWRDYGWLVHDEPHGFRERVVRRGRLRDWRVSRRRCCHRRCGRRGLLPTRTGGGRREKQGDDSPKKDRVQTSGVHHVFFQCVRA